MYRQTLWPTLALHTLSVRIWMLTWRPVGDQMRHTGTAEILNFESLLASNMKHSCLKSL